MCAKYEFEKPNDKRALDLMNAAAKAVVTDLPEIVIAYGFRLSQDLQSLREESKGTLAAEKNEILFSRFQINYNNELEIFKKGSIIFRDYELVEPNSHNEAAAADALAEPVAQSKSQAEKDKKRRTKAKVVVEHIDIIRDEFWDRRPWILSGKPGQPGKAPKVIQT
ncbi:hypothetical protein ACHAQJ_009474 [Trichoderma viride]